ncbi:sugar diacid recognition domain-containing protein [Neisseria sp. Ec49-e6-T10]|uniref:sugar diacid recognition domain-containing protein n=1 Tax=Neisseria sp. Ec49-e6-T10 TaxID=3140744 RepID=UPI003EBB722A
MAVYSLSEKLAQQIVDKTMQIINCNVNIINTKGQIIGSGNTERLGELHEGALLALSRKEVVSIDEEGAKNLHGVRPGVNLPLQIDGEIVGVIGLTGEPTHLKQFGQLVCMSAQMMMEQARLLHDLAQESRLREELVLNLIQAEELTPKLLEWGQRLGIDLTIPRVACIIEINIDIEHSEVESAIYEFKGIQDHLYTQHISDLYAVQSLTKMIVLIPALNQHGHWDTAEHKTKLEKILAERKKSAAQLNMKMALGHYFTDEKNNIAKSYQTANTTLLIGKQRKPEEKYYQYHDLILPVLLDGLNSGWQALEFLYPLNQLKQQDNNGLLLKTLRVWFKNNLQMGATAKALYVHRNTLEYRLNKISSITGLRMDLLDDRLLLYIAVLLDK